MGQIKKITQADGTLIYPITITKGIVDTDTNKLLSDLLDSKVDKEDGKGLSTNNYTTEEKTKLAGIEEGATKITVDSALRNSSNPIQNRVVQAAINAQAGNTLLMHHDTDHLTAVSLKGGYVTDEKVTRNNAASRQYATAIGMGNTASGVGSFATGEAATASGKISHTEGYQATASGMGSHAEGRRTFAEGAYSHAEGFSDVDLDNPNGLDQPFTRATGEGSHAEGYRTVASGARAHAEGGLTVAAGTASHAEGWFTETTNTAEHASSIFNKSTQSDNSSERTLYSVGMGTEDNRKNAFEIKRNGDIYFGETNITQLLTDLQTTLGNLEDRVQELDTKAPIDNPTFINSITIDTSDGTSSVVITPSSTELTTISNEDGGILQFPYVEIGTTETLAVQSDIDSLESTIASLQNDIFGITLGTTGDEILSQYNEVKKLLDDIGYNINWSTDFDSTENTIPTGIYGYVDASHYEALGGESTDNGGEIAIGEVTDYGTYKSAIVYGLKTGHGPRNILYLVDSSNNITFLSDSNEYEYLYGAKLYGLKDK